MGFPRLASRVTLRQLQVFEAVREQRSYSRAAELLGLTQSAVSQQVKQLESMLGHPLFEYVGRRLYITAAGERVAAAAGDISRNLTNLEMQLSGLGGTPTGELNLAAVSTAQYFLPRLLADFRRHYPAVDFRLAIVNRAQILDRLAANRDDLVIMGLVPEDRALAFFPFLDNVMLAMARPDHPLAGAGPIRLARLADEPVLLREQGSGTRRAFDNLCAERRVRLERPLELGSSEAIKQGVLAGLGIGVLPALAVQEEQRAGTLLSLDVEGFPLRRSWCLVYPRAKQVSPVARLFIDYLQENLKNLAALAGMVPSEAGAIQAGSDQ